MAAVLVAEDEPDIRDLIRSVLEHSGHRVLEARNGNEVWTRLQEGPVDLVLLDIMLPGMDGHTVQMKLSEDPVLRKIPVIMISALEYAKDMFNKFPNVRDFLPKPFSPLQLDEAVRRIVPAETL